MSELRFPDAFKWGAAVSGHQVEGHNRHSDWWHWEQKGDIYDGTRSGAAVDHWNRYPEDHQLMVDLGLNAFRFGIEWARVEPREGHFDETAIATYRAMLESLREQGISICLTLHHWVLPKWVADRGDWTNPDTERFFLRYVERMVEAFGEYPDLWITLNEPMVVPLAANLAGEFPPQRRSFRAFRRVVQALLRVHAKSYALIHDRVPNAPDGGPTMVGVAQAYPYLEAWGSTGLRGCYERRMEQWSRRLVFRAWDDALATGELKFPIGRGVIEGLEDSIDFCGVNYYFRMSLRFSWRCVSRLFIDIDSIPEGVEQSEMGWQIWPQGFGPVLDEVWQRFGKPIYITENGIADAEDRHRAHYLVRHLSELHSAIERGIPVKGYFHWSLLDNFEWREGFAKKFGLIEVDHTDPELARSLRQSAKLYARIIEANAIPTGASEDDGPD